MQARPEQAGEYRVAALNRALDGVTGTTAVHICFGYASLVKGRPAGGYSFLSELGTTPVHQVSIEAYLDLRDPFADRPTWKMPPPLQSPRAPRTPQRPVAPTEPPPPAAPAPPMWHSEEEVRMFSRLLARLRGARQEDAPSERIGSRDG